MSKTERTAPTRTPQGLISISEAVRFCREVRDSYLEAVRPATAEQCLGTYNDNYCNEHCTSIPHLVDGTTIGSFAIKRPATDASTDAERDGAYKVFRENYGESHVRPQDAWDAAWKAARSSVESPWIAVKELNHLAWVIVHKVLEPEKGFGRCSCDTCSLLREIMKSIREREAKEYMAIQAPPTAERSKETR